MTATEMGDLQVLACEACQAIRADCVDDFVEQGLTPKQAEELTDELSAAYRNVLVYGAHPPPRFPDTAAEVEAKRGRDG